MFMLTMAFADTTTQPPAYITINPGSLAISSSGQIDLTAVDLDGEDHDSSGTGAPSFTLIDATGSGAGWNITFESTDFSDGSHTIPASQFKFTSGGSIAMVTGQAVDPSYGPIETGLSSAPLDSAQKVITTATDYGKGKYTYDPSAGDFVLTVYADTMAGAYTATVTATIVSGP